MDCTIQSRIVKTVELTFEDALQKVYANSNNALEAGLSILAGQELGGLVRSDSFHIVPKTQMPNPVKTKSVANKFVQKVL